MTKDNRPGLPQPTRPHMRGAQKYDVLRELTARPPKPASVPVPTPTPTSDPQREQVFTVTFIATREKGLSMDNENKLLIELIFKPNENRLKLRPQETQLLLSYWSEILREIEDEEAIIENAKVK